MAEGTSLALADKGIVQHGSVVRVDFLADVVDHGSLCLFLVGNVESEQVSAYTENDEELLGTLGGSLAAIIANARLLEQIRRQAERERVIYEITDKIRRTTDMQTILTTTASELTRAVGASRAHIKIAISESAAQSKVKS